MPGLVDGPAGAEVPPVPRRRRQLSTSALLLQRLVRQQWRRRWSDLGSGGRCRGAADGALRVRLLLLLAALLLAQLSLFPVVSRRVHLVVGCGLEALGAPAQARIDLQGQGGARRQLIQDTQAAERVMQQHAREDASANSTPDRDEGVGEEEERGVSREFGA